MIRSELPDVEIPDVSLTDFVLTGAVGRGDKPGLPSGTATARWRSDRIGVDSAACDQPADD